MKSYAQIPHDGVPQYGRDDALDESEKEYNRMISKHTTYHRLLMDDLMKLSSESGSGSGSNNLIQQQLAQSNQSNLIRGMGATIGNLNATDQRLMETVSGFTADTNAKSKEVTRLNRNIVQNTSKLNETIDSYNALIEGFANQGPTMDAALEVSNRMKESHKYAFFIFGIVAIYVLYKTTKQLRTSE
jgi:pentatricopeptide repeat protein